MKFASSPIFPEVIIIEPAVYDDQRGFFLEIYHEKIRALYAPQFAHGFCVLSEQADVIYKCSELYAPNDEHGILWNDPELSISWPWQDPILSPKDILWPLLDNADLF